jgi:hypothetical protein
MNGISGSKLSAIVRVCEIGGISGSTLLAIVPVCRIGNISGSILSANPALTERGITSMLLLIPQVFSQYFKQQSPAGGI